MATATRTRKANRSFGHGFYSPMPSHIDVGAVFNHFVRSRLLDDYDRFSLRDCRNRPRPANDVTYGPFQVWGRRVSPVDGTHEWRRVSCYSHPNDARAFKMLAERYYPRG